MTQRTERIGEKYSPDMVCTPFKTILGSIVEALEAGADTIVMPNGIDSNGRSEYPCLIQKNIATSRNG